MEAVSVVLAALAHLAVMLFLQTSLLEKTVGARVVHVVGSLPPGLRFVVKPAKSREYPMIPDRPLPEVVDSKSLSHVPCPATLRGPTYSAYRHGCSTQMRTVESAGVEESMARLHDDSLVLYYGSLSKRWRSTSPVSDVVY